MQTTSELLNTLLSAKDLAQFLSENADKQQEIALCDYLEALLVTKNRKKADVVRLSQLDTTYGYQMFQGLRIPTRDKLIQLAFGFSLNFEETEKLLHVAGAGDLYVKNKRDSIIIFALNSGLPLTRLNCLLEDEGLECLC